MDVAARQRAAVLEALALEGQALLAGRDALVVLQQGFDEADGIEGLCFQGDGPAGHGLHKELHAATAAPSQVERGLLLYVAKATSADSPRRSGAGAEMATG